MSLREQRSHISFSYMTELSNAEADDPKEEAPEAPAAGDPTQETKSKRRKRKAKTTKHPEGESALFFPLRLKRVTFGTPLFMALI